MSTSTQRPAEWDHEITVGDDYTATFTSITLDAAAYGWTGATVTSAITSQGGATVATSWTITTPSDGVLTYSLTDTDTTTLAAGTYRYWIRVTKAGLTRGIVSGVITLSPADRPKASTSSSATLAITTGGTATLALTSTAPATAAGVAFTPASGIAATNVQAAIVEVVADVASQYQAFGGAPFVVTGDSITASNSDMSVASWADGWATHCVLSSAGALKPTYNAGHGGYTSTQLAALFATEVVAYAPKVIGILAGTNDTLDGSNQPTTTATNIKAMVAAGRAAGAFVFLGTLPPQGTAALSAPSAPTPAVLSTGGTLAAATYRYQVTATNSAGETTVSATGSVVVASGTTNSINVDITHVDGATGYKVYKETTPGSGTYGLVATLSTSGQQYIPNKRYTDTGSVSPTTAPPGSNTTAVAWDSTAQRKIATINAWLRRYAQAYGVPLVDFHGLLVDATTGMYQTGWTRDGTHPTPTAQRRMGALAWSTISARIPATIPAITQDNADPLNLYGNGCLINGTASLPTSWASYGGSGSGFTDTLGTKTGFAGKALQCALTAPDARFHDSLAISSGWSVGDRILCSFMLQIEGSEAGGGNVNITVRSSGSNQNLGNLYLSACNIGPGIWSMEFTVPAATTNFYLKAPYLGYGPCTASIGQVTWYNLTTGGILNP